MPESPLGEATSGTDASGKEVAKCPTCGDCFDSEKGMKIHHSSQHGESIAGVEVECHWCGGTFRKTRFEAKRYERQFCPGGDCHAKWREEFSKGENNPSYEGATVQGNCAWCGEIIERYQSELKGRKRIYCDQNCKAAWRSENRSGENHPSWKGGTVNCSWCGEELDRDMNQIERSEHFFCGDKNCRAMWQSENHSGKSHPRYKGGHINYYGKNWPDQREKARERDGHTCQSCGLAESNSPRELAVHHIIPKRKYRQRYDAPEWWRRANRLGNLVTLCRPCHRKWEGIPLQPDRR